MGALETAAALLPSKRCKTSAAKKELRFCSSTAGGSTIDWKRVTCPLAVISCMCQKFPNSRTLSKLWQSWRSYQNVIKISAGLAFVKRNRQLGKPTGGISLQKCFCPMKFLRSLNYLKHLDTLKTP